MVCAMITSLACAKHGWDAPIFANFYSSLGSTYTIQWKVNIICMF